MSNEIKITGLVPKNEIKAMGDLLTLFKDTKDAYEALADKLAGGLNIKPASLQELKLKTEDATKVIREMAETQNQLAKIQEDYKKVVLQLNEATKKSTATIVEEAKAKDLNAAATLKTEKAETERLKQQKMANQEAKQRKVSIEEAIALTKVEAKTEREATEQIKLLRMAKKDVDITTEEGRKTILQLNSAIDKNNALLKNNADSLVKAKMNVGMYKSDIKAAMAEISSGNVSIKNMGDLAKSTGGYLKSGMSVGLQEVSIGVGTMIKGMVGAQAVIGLFQKMIGLFKSGVQSIIDFEAANSKLAAVLGTTSKNIKDLIADAQRLGATTKYTAAEATNLQIELAKLGFSKTEILQSTEYVLKFAQATGAELPEAAALAGASLRMFNADTTETERYVSAMAVATTKSALSFSYLQTAMPIVGPVAKAFNFQIEDTLALLGKLSDAGFDASMAATATRNILLNLADGSGKLATALGGPVKSLPELVAGLKKLKEQNVDLATTLELTDKRSVSQFNTFLRVADSILPLREQITGVSKELGEMADEMGNNVQGAVAGLSSAWEALMLTFSKDTGPAKSFIDWVAVKIRKIADLLKDPEQRIEADSSKLQLAAQKEVQTKMEIQELEFQKRIEQLRKDYVQKHLNEGLKEDAANAKAVEEAQIQAAKEALVALALIKGRQKEIRDEDLRNLNKSKSVYEQTLKDWEENGSFLGLNFKNAGAKLFGYKTEEIKNANKAFVEFANIQMDVSKAESYIKALDQMIGKMTDISEPVDNKGTSTITTLTDEQKKELEKQAKERQRILEAMQQSELDLMDEGLNKEIEKISLSYTKKMAVVKGMSEEERKTRENLAKEMKRAIEDKTIDYSIAQEQKMISDKLEAVKKGSQEEYDLKVEQLELQRDVEVIEAIKTGNDILLIEEKYNAKRAELLEGFSSEKAKKIEEGSAVQSIILNHQMQQEIDDLTESYSKGLKDKETYEREKAEITEKYAIIQAQLAVDLAKAQLSVGSFFPEDRLTLEKKIADAEIALSAAVRDAKISDIDRTAKEREEDMNNLMDKIQMAGDFLNAFSDLGASLFEGRIQKIEEEQDTLDESKEAELEKIQKLEESGAISKEEAEARKRAAEDKTAQKDKELAKKKADLQTKQAKMDKANNIMQAIMNTSLAIIKQSVATPLPLGLPFIAAISALGAVQLAAIIAQPIPKYREGTKDHPGGMAVVGDGGQKEVIITPSGDSFITPNIATMVDIPKHSMVFPDMVGYVKQIKPKSDLGLTMKEAEMRGEPISINVNNDYRSLEKEMRRMSDSFDSLAKYQRKAAVESELNYLKSRL